MTKFISLMIATLLCLMMTQSEVIMSLEVKNTSENDQVMGENFEEDNGMSSLLREIEKKYTKILASSQLVIEDILWDSSIDSYAINGGGSDQGIYLKDDLYLFESIEFSEKSEIVAEDYNIYIMPKFHLALNQCESLTNVINENEDEHLKTLWSNLLSNSKTSTSISELKQELKEIKYYSSSQALTTQDSFYTSISEVFNFILAIDESVPTITINHTDFSIRLWGASIYVSNQATLHLNQGNIAYDGINNKTDSVIEVESGGKIIGTSLAYDESASLASVEYASIMNYSSVGVTIAYDDENTDVIQLSNLNLHSNGEAFFSSRSPLYLNSLDLTSSKELAHLSIVKDSVNVVLDQCSLDEEVMIDKDSTYQVEREFSKQLTQSEIEINQENVDDYLGVLPTSLSMELVPIENEEYGKLSDVFKKIIQEHNEYTTPFFQYTGMTNANETQVILTPAVEEDIQHNAALDPYLEKIRINLKYVDLPIKSKYFNATYDTETKCLKYSYYLHAFTNFTPYLDHPTLEQTVQIDDFKDHPEILINLNSTINQYYEEWVEYEGTNLYEGSRLRLVFTDARFYGESIDIPIISNGELPKPPKPAGSDDDDTGETTGGGGRDEVDREPEPDLELTENEPGLALTEKEPIEEKPVIEDPILEIPKSDANKEIEISIVDNGNNPIAEKEPLTPVKNEEILKEIVKEEKEQQVNNTGEIKKQAETSEEKMSFMNRVRSTIENTFEVLVDGLNKIVSFVVEGVNHFIDWLMSFIF